MKPYKILGKYKWSKRYCSIIGKELTEFTKTLGFVPLGSIGGKNNVKAAWSDDELHAEVRMTAVPGSEGTGWHQDGDTTLGASMDHGLIVWANTHPTQFRVWDDIWQPEPFEVVLFKNLDGMHRRPPDTPAKRFMFRQRVEI